MKEIRSKESQSLLQHTQPKLHPNGSPVPSWPPTTIRINQHNQDGDQHKQMLNFKGCKVSSRLQTFFIFISCSQVLKTQAMGCLLTLGISEG